MVVSGGLVASPKTNFVTKRMGSHFWVFLIKIVATVFVIPILGCRCSVDPPLSTVLPTTIIFKAGVEENMFSRFSTNRELNRGNYDPIIQYIA